MLAELPPEIISEIVTYLPTVWSVVNLAQTCRSLYAKISENDYEILRGFVLNKFPSINVPRHWKDAARVLTSRSRAWDRRAFVARVLQPDEGGIRISSSGEILPENSPRIRQTIGYTPVIDSYEIWAGGSWSDRAEVLAWGAGSKLMIRSRPGRRKDLESRHEDAFASNEVSNGRHRHRWIVHEDHRTGSAEEDILDVHLLRASQKLDDGREEVIIRRANESISRVSIDLQKATASKQHFYRRNQAGSIDCMDMRKSDLPLLAVCQGDGSISIYDASLEGDQIHPLTANPPRNSYGIYRKRCIRFLDERRFAVSCHRGGVLSPVQVYELREDCSVDESTCDILFPFLHKPSVGRVSSVVANILAPLQTSSTGRSSGDLFLAGCSDGSTRLHDLRTSEAQVAVFTDTVDDGQILSLLSIGHERFLAGSHQNACLKTFDLRWTGNRPYSYLGDSDMTRSLAVNKNQKLHSPLNPRLPPKSQRRRDYNVFLAIPINPRQRTFISARQTGRASRGVRSERYRGSVYALSSPSMTSSTIYAGIENHVLQLDFAASDDLLGRQREWYRDDLDLDVGQSSDFLSLSAYDRPLTLEDQMPIKLRNQLDFGQKWPGEAEQGWDPRWRIATLDRWRSDRART